MRFEARAMKTKLYASFATVCMRLRLGNWWLCRWIGEA